MLNKHLVAVIKKPTLMVFVEIKQQNLKRQNTFILETKKVFVVKR